MSTHKCSRQTINSFFWRYSPSKSYRGKLIDTSMNAKVIDLWLIDGQYHRLFHQFINPHCRTTWAFMLKLNDSTIGSLPRDASRVSHGGDVFIS